MLSFFKKAREIRRPRCAALVAAAGSSSRMGGVNKLLQPLEGVPVLVRTLAALQVAGSVDEIVVAAREEDILEISQLCRTYGLTKCAKVIRGGENRVHSVLLAALEASPEIELLAVQDGARPLVTPELVDRVVSAAARRSRRGGERYRQGRPKGRRGGGDPGPGAAPGRSNASGL